MTPNKMQLKNVMNGGTDFLAGHQLWSLITDMLILIQET